MAKKLAKKFKPTLKRIKAKWSEKIREARAENPKGFYKSQTYISLIKRKKRAIYRYWLRKLKDKIDKGPERKLVFSGTVYEAYTGGLRLQEALLYEENKTLNFYGEISFKTEGLFGGGKLSVRYFHDYSLFRLYINQIIRLMFKKNKKDFYRAFETNVKVYFAADKKTFFLTYKFYEKNS